MPDYKIDPFKTTMTINGKGISNFPEISVDDLIFKMRNICKPKPILPSHILGLPIVIDPTIRETFVMNHDPVIEFGDFNRAYVRTIKFKIKTASQRNMKKKHGKNTVTSRRKRGLIKFNKKSSIKKLHKELNKQAEKRVNDVLFDIINGCVTVN